MKAILEFDLLDPEDRIEHQRMLKSTDLQVALWDISQVLRSKVKYAPDDISEDTFKAYEEIQEMFYDIINEHKIDLEL
jgi:hypothetical protein